MYQKIFFDVLEVSIVVSIIVLITFFCLSIINKRYGFKWRKLLWFILAIRLLTPYNFTLPNAPIRLFQSDKIVVQEGKRIYLSKHSSETVFEDVPSVEQKIGNETQGKSENIFEIPLLTLLGIIWGIGFFVYLRNQQINYQYFLKNLDESISVMKGPYYQLLREVCKEMQMNRVPNLYVNDTITTPFIIGYFKPVLFLPKRQYQKRELEFIYRHECTHYKSHDLPYKLVVTIAVGMHWFNPIIHYMKTLAFHDIELVCDQKMSNILTHEEKKMYCNMLIHTAWGQRSKEPDLSTCFLGNKKILKQRMENIFDKKMRKKGVLPILSILGVMIIFGIMITCGKPVSIPKRGEKSKFSISNQFVLKTKDIEKLHLNEPFVLENYYCKERTTYANSYKIDEKGVLWKNSEKISENVKHIDTSENWGEDMLVFLTESGELYGIGSNPFGLLTGQDIYGPTITTPKLLMEEVSYARCGRESVTALKTDNSVWIWGRYQSFGSEYSDIESASGYPEIYYPEPVCVVKDATFISSGLDTAAAITKKGELWTWGSNLYKECGPAELKKDCLEPEKRVDDVKFVWYENDYNNTFIEREDGSLWVCGRDIGGETKKINFSNGYGLSGEIKDIVCSSQFYPLELQ